MYESQQWPEFVASFVIGNETQPSYVTLGGYPDASAYTGHFVKQPLVKKYSMWWTMRLTNIKIGPNSGKLNAKYFAIADTGTSFLYLLEEDFSSFKVMVMNASSDFICDTVNAGYCYSNVTTCDAYWAQLEPLTLFLDHNIYVIQPEGYTISNAWEGSACVVAVSYTSNNDVYVLGDTFLRNFVSVFDYKHNTISFAVSATAPAGTSATLYIGTLNIVWVCLAGLVVLYLVWRIYDHCKMKKKQKQEAQLKAQLEEQGVDDKKLVETTEQPIEEQE